MRLEEFEDDIPQDFRRANGAPMVMVDGKNERFSRPSGWGKDLDDENALVQWKLWIALVGASNSPALRAKIVATKDEDKVSKKQLIEEAIQTGRGNEASDTGTALHAMSCRWEDPDDEFDPGEYRADLEAYQAELDRLGLASEAFEFRIVNVDYRAAGTADRLYRLTRDLTVPDGSVLPAGTLVVGDLKTGKKLDFSLPSYCVQMALYAQGQWYDVATESFIETPPVNQRWGILVHLPVGQARCEMRWVDLDTGNWGAWLTSEVRAWRKKWRSGEFDAPIVPDPVMTPEAVAEKIEDSELIDLHHPEWVDMMSPFAQERIKRIGQEEEARTALMQRWPAGVPTIKQGVEDPQHMTLILDLLDSIERQFGLPFPGPDPRIQHGVHRNAMTPISNTEPQKADS